MPGVATGAGPLATALGQPVAGLRLLPESVTFGFLVGFSVSVSEAARDAVGVLKPFVGSGVGSSYPPPPQLTAEIRATKSSVVEITIHLR